MTYNKPILAISKNADFYPGLKDGENLQDFNGNHIEWTFAIPRIDATGPGVYEIRFIRNLSDEESMGFPVLGESLSDNSHD